MQYNEFGKTGIKMSALGFGAMHLPMHKVDGHEVINDDLAIPMLQKAIELGVNYIDTAPSYCHRLSEVAVGKAIKGFRDKVYISTKNPIENDSADDWMKRLEGSLTKLDVDYIDFYHFWGIGLNGFKHWETLSDGPLQAAQRALDQGLVKHLSFSYHDAAQNMKYIIDSGRFESVLCQYNLLDRQNEENLAYAKSKGLGTVVMGPIAGGRLGAPSEVIQGLLKNKHVSTSEMALRFVTANPAVDIALSGMRTMEQLLSNAAVAAIETGLTTEEYEHVLKMMDENKKLAELYCTGCNYCKPCPQEIDIPFVFDLMNQHKVFGLKDHARGQYGHLIRGDGGRKSKLAPDCTECGECEKKCPQKLPIIQQIKETHKELS